jgi:UDP-N-acetylglucosamine 2-epimerase (non-hydrolysing)
MTNKFAIIFGTRPEYLKLKCLIDEFKNKQIEHQVIYVSQHETIDEIMDNLFIKLIIEKTTHDRLSNIGSEILLKLPEIIKDYTHILIQGDTATAFYSALVGFQLNKIIIHIEAGLRTYDLNRPFPEEAYRQMISRISSINFTPHDDSLKILNHEKVTGIIINVGNTILDLINSYNLQCKMENIVLITFHRRENWDKIDNLLIGLKKLVKITPQIKYIWYLHHNPELQKKVRISINDISSIELREPCNHLEFTKQISLCNFLITDSGGIQEEASFLGKHTIVLRASTERSHIPKDYITILEDYSLLDKIYETIPKKHLSPCNVYGYGESSKKIIDIINDPQNNKHS